MPYDELPIFVFGRIRKQRKPCHAYGRRWAPVIRRFVEDVYGRSESLVLNASEQIHRPVRIHDFLSDETRIRGIYHSLGTSADNSNLKIQPVRALEISPH